MTVDAVIIVKLQKLANYTEGSEGGTSQEALCPDRHKIALPINSLNGLFTTCYLAVNNHSQYSGDGYVFYSIGVIKKKPVRSIILITHRCLSDLPLSIRSKAGS